MALHSEQRRALGAPGRREHAVQFCRHCHLLVAIGYREIRAEPHDKSDEDRITQRLVDAIKASQRTRTLPTWADRYFVRDQVRVSHPERVGKDRPIIDIEVESTGSSERPLFHFESKRLRREDSHSVSEYVGPAGLGSFVSELYSRAGAEGGMLGYVQSESMRYWPAAIRRKLEGDSKNPHQLTDDGAWIRIQLIPALKDTYLTRHNRPTLGRIAIYHTLLDFRSEDQTRDGD